MKYRAIIAFFHDGKLYEPGVSCDELPKEFRNEMIEGGHIAKMVKVKKNGRKNSIKVG